VCTDPASKQLYKRTGRQQDTEADGREYIVVGWRWHGCVLQAMTDGPSDVILSAAPQQHQQRR